MCNTRLECFLKVEPHSLHLYNLCCLADPGFLVTMIPSSWHYKKCIYQYIRHIFCRTLWWSHCHNYHKAPMILLESAWILFGILPFQSWWFFTFLCIFKMWSCPKLVAAAWATDSIPVNKYGASLTSLLSVCIPKMSALSFWFVLCTYSVASYCHDDCCCLLLQNHIQKWKEKEKLFSFGLLNAFLAEINSLSTPFLPNSAPFSTPFSAVSLIFFRNPIIIDSSQRL